jgi:hypothetical protein
MDAMRWALLPVTLLLFFVAFAVCAPFAIVSEQMNH